MEEHELAALFRDAVRDAPPASFDDQDVARTSQRITARRRSTAMVGAAIGALVLVGGTIAGAGLLARTASTSAGLAAAPASQGDPPRRAGGDSTSYTVDVAPPSGGSGVGTPAKSGVGTPPKSVPEIPSTQGEDPSGKALSLPDGCGPVDGELAAALAGELPATAGTQPVAVSGPCPSDARSAGYVVRDGGAAGLFSVVLAPVGGFPSAEANRPPGTRSLSVRAASGKNLTVLSEPQPGSTTPPFPADVHTVAVDLAKRF